MEYDFQGEEPEIPELFAACKGLRIWCRSTQQALRIEPGVYANGQGALILVGEDGEVDSKITVNMDASPGAVGRLSKASFWAHITDMHIETELLKLGIFEKTGEQMSSGWDRAYATIWRFAGCYVVAHGWLPSAALCPKCMENARDMYVVRDTVRRLKGADL